MSQPSTSPIPVIVVAGGLGAGKSTVAAMLAAKGATTIDADQIGHQVLEPGGPAFTAVAERWPLVIDDGTIDRLRLAAIVFSDVEQLEELEAITHPAIGAEIARRAHEAGPGPVVVELPVPGIVGPDWTWIAVVADPAIRLERAVARGMEADDARRRIAAQLTEAEWRQRATHVIVNDGSTDDLQVEVDELWKRLASS